MMPVRSKSRHLLLVCIYLMILTGLQCGEGTDRLSTDESKVTVLYIGDERIFFQDYWGMEATYLMFLPLVTDIGDEKGELQPVLAERWEHSEDYRKWTFFLRKDIKWHDGVAFTAHDVKFTMDLRQHPGVVGGKLDRYSVEILDNHTLTVTYREPTDGLDKWYVYYPKHLLQDLDPTDFASWEFWTHPVGNGPYRYVRHVPRTMIELEANHDFYKGKPEIERVVLKFSEEPSLTELLSGNVDALTYVDRISLLKLAGDSRFRAYHWWGSSQIDAIYWQHRHSLFGEPVVRRALTLAINRHELAKVLNYPDDVPIVDTICTSRQFRLGQCGETLPYDPEMANQLLERAGWRDEDRNGVRERAGQEFRFTAIVVVELQRHAIYVQEQLRRVGIRMEIQTMDANILKPRLLAGEFEAAIFHFQNATEPRFGHLRFLGEDSPIGYTNPEFIKLLNAAKNTLEPDERNHIYLELIPIFQADLPLTLLLPQVQTHVVHRRVRGLSSPYRPDPVWFMEDLWLENED